MKKLKILVVGAGMYTCGKGTEGHGTIMPTLFQGFHDGLVESVRLTATSRASAREAREKCHELAGIFGLEMPLDFLPEDTELDEEAFLKALDRAPLPDCAIVVVPDHLHHAVTKPILQKKIHVLVVKPFTPTVGEATDLIREADAAGVYGAVEFHKRFDQSNLKLLRYIKTGRLGDLLQFNVEYSQRKIIPSKIFRAWVERTDIFQYLGVHYVDLIHFMTRALPMRVMSVGRSRWLEAQHIRAHDTMQTLIEWRKEGEMDFLSSHYTGWVDPNCTSAMSDQKITAIGTKGRCFCDQKHRGLQLVTDGEGVEDINPYFSQFYPTHDARYLRFGGYGPESVLTFLRDVIEIQAGRLKREQLEESRPTFRNALVSTAVIEAHHRSLASNGAWSPVANTAL